MKKGESIGALIGSLVGAVGTGIAIYFTGSVWSALIGVLGYFGGNCIGKLYDRRS